MSIFLRQGKVLTKNLLDPKFLIKPFLRNFLEKYVKYKVTNLSYRSKQLEASGEVAITNKDIKLFNIRAGYDKPCKNNSVSLLNY